MRRAAAGLALLGLASLAGGCAVVVTTASVVGAVAATTVATAGKVTVATVKTGGKIIASTVTAGGDVTALTIESAAKLARAGAVVAVDAGTGAVTELPWRDGLRLYAAIHEGQLGGAYRSARIFRGAEMLAADLSRGGAGNVALHSGDVVELRL